MASDAEHTLPGVITSISVQKKNKSRYSIFVDDRFLIGVSESTLIDLKLARGVEVTPSLFKKIQRREGRADIKSYLMKLLARRDHSRRELLNKSRKKEYPEEIVRRVLDELEQKGYIDEEKFAEKFASEKSELSQWGPAKVRAHLFKKGIDKPLIDRVISKVFEHFDFRETFLNLVLKRKRRFLREEDPYKRKKKVVDHLQRKGFRSTDIFTHIDELMEAISDE